MELLYRKSKIDSSYPIDSNIRWLSDNEYSIFNAHLELCGQKQLAKLSWDEIYNEGTVYCGYFTEGKMAGRACVEKYSESAWEVADVRVAKPYRNQEYAYKLCYFVLSYIVSQGKIATIRTEEDNFAMQRVIEKIGFTRYFPD